MLTPNIRKINLHITWDDKGLNQECIDVLLKQNYLNEYKV